MPDRPVEQSYRSAEPASCSRMTPVFVLMPAWLLFPDLHHCEADSRAGFFLCIGNLLPSQRSALETIRLSYVLHCNMASATIVAAMTSVGPTKPRQGHQLNHKHMRNAA